MTDPTPDDDAFPSRGRIAAVDYGTKRIGLAICDPDWILASPLEVYHVRSAERDAAHFARLTREERISGYVVGLPIHCDGTESEKSRESRRFAQWLHEATGCAVRLFDERFTTSAARQRLRSGGAKRTNRRPVDAIAALVLLESFLEACRYRQHIAGEPLTSAAEGGDALDDGPG